MSKVDDVTKNISYIQPYDIDEKNVSKNKVKPRETWTGSLDFFVSALGYAVGVGNVWRFPYLCYNNGGGAFLIPYFVCMIILGIPLVYLEMIVGQFTSSGSLKCWRMVKIFKGIGLAMNIANALLIIYYNMIIAYSIYYFFMSFRSELPWVKCRPEFASNNCVDDYSPENFHFTQCNNITSMLKCEDSYNFGRCFNLTTLNGTMATCDTNRELLNQIGWWKTSFPSQDFWNKQILMKSSSIDETGAFIWQLFLALFTSWLIIYLMVIKGIKTSGKLVWFTALFPYLVLVILGIRGWLLPGAIIGIEFYVYPKWERLIDIQVWRDAAIQIFFTLSVSYGGMSTLASYNNFNHKIRRDAILIPLANCCTSFFAGFIIFSYMGYLSHITHQDINDIIQAGQGLAFVVYPYAVTTIKGAPFWSCLFFMMMLLLGVDSTMTCVETSITSIMDAFPSIKAVRIRRYSTITLMSMFYFLSGIIFCFQSGSYWMEFFAAYVGDWAVIIGGFFECIIVAWFYGLRNLQTDIECMLGKQNTWSYYIWWALWACITPCTILILVVLALMNLKILTLGDYVFPEWTFTLGLLVTSSSLIGFFTWMIYEIFDTLLIKKKPFSTLFKPDFDAYQPLLNKNIKLVKQARQKNEKNLDTVQELPREERF